MKVNFKLKFKMMIKFKVKIIVTYGAKFKGLIQVEVSVKAHTTPFSMGQAWPTALTPL